MVSRDISRASRNFLALVKFIMDTNSFEEHETTGNDRYLTSIALIAGVSIIGLAFYFGHGTAPTLPKNNTTAHDTATTQTTVDIKNVKIDGEPYVGSKDAPVTIAVWFDYQCPFCKMLDDNTLAQVYTNYVKDGNVKIVFKDFPFLGPDSGTDALYARAVWVLYPEKFYDWYKAMFAAQDKENSGFGDLASVEKLTKTIPGIDVAKVFAFVEKNKKDLIEAMVVDKKEGKAFGIKGSPSMIIGTKLLNGAVPYNNVSALIDAELSKK